MYTRGRAALLLASLAVLGLSGTAWADCGGCEGGMCPKAKAHMEMMAQPAADAGEADEATTPNADLKTVEPDKPAAVCKAVGAQTRAACEADGKACPKHKDCPMRKSAATGEGCPMAKDCPMHAGRAAGKACPKHANAGKTCPMCAAMGTHAHRTMRARKQVNAALAALEKGDRDAAAKALKKAQALLAPPAGTPAKDAMAAGKPVKATPAPAAPADGAVANARCPIMGGKLDRANVPGRLTVTFRGRKVGFCCGGCPAQWAQLSEAEKAKKLQTALPKTN